jgi:hypothetical protein
LPGIIGDGQNRVKVGFTKKPEKPEKTIKPKTQKPTKWPK